MASCRSGSSDSHHRQGVEKVPSASASSRGPATQQRKESESSVASGSGQPHPHSHPEKKKPTTKAERRAQQVDRYT